MRASPFQPDRSPAAPRSILGSVGRALLFLVLLAVMTVAAQAVLAAPIAWVVARTGVHVRMNELLTLAGALAATAVMVRGIDVRPWADVGLSRAAARARPVWLGTLLGGAVIAAASALLLAVGWLDVVPAADGSSLGAAVSVTAFLLPAALAEEVVCRGYLLTALRDGMGTRAAVVVTSLLFGVLHAQNAGADVASVLVVTLAGVFLAAVRVAFDSLYAAWGAHLAWNWVMAVPLHAPVSGLRFAAPDYRTVSAGPEWATGGAWGPEGGLAATVGMVGALAYLYVRHRRDATKTRPGREESTDT